MIAGSRSLAALALVLAVAIHAALGWALIADADIEMEGSAGPQQARIGTSFADMAAGTLQADAPDVPIQQPTPPDAATPLKADPAQPVQAESAKPVEAQMIEPRKIAPELAEDAVPTIPALKPAQAEPAAKAAPMEAETAKEPLAAEDDQAVSRSLRPKRRSAEFETKNKRMVKKPAPKPEKTRQPKAQPRGNAEQTGRAGTTTGNARAKAATSSDQGGNAAGVGNAAASNYPGKVMQRLSRASRPRVGARGTAVIAFTISGGGGLAGVSVARSSGSAALDQAAARMVRGAAPFPPPPPGAQRSFSISIEGR